MDMDEVVARLSTPTVRVFSQGLALGVVVTVLITVPQISSLRGSLQDLRSNAAQCSSELNEKADNATNLQTTLSSVVTNLDTTNTRASELQQTVLRLKTGVTVEGTWRGTYTCGQSLTALTLAVTPDGQNAVRALFAFSPLAENPTAPTGFLLMHGTIGNNGSLSLSATSKDWVVRPTNYNIQSLQGHLSTDDDSVTLEGTISGQDHTATNCTNFTLERVEADSNS